jgi:hypothetical protein
MEKPALNPTTNVTSKKPPPLGGLSYERDPSRPGGGVFIAHGDVKGAYTEMAPDLVIESNSDEDDEEGAPSAGAAEQEGSEAQSATTQDEKVNVNPVLNEGGMTGSENVRLMNLLDSAPASTRALEQFAMADNNWLDGIPGGMFDWGQWDEFFTRLGNSGNGSQGIGNGNVMEQPRGGTATTKERPTATEL